MRNAFDIIMTLDIATNAWLIDSYLKATKCYAWRCHLRNVMADIKIALRNTRGQSRTNIIFLFMEKKKAYFNPQNVFKVLTFLV